MDFKTSSFANLPTPVKAIVAAASGGSILTAIAIIFPPRVCLVLFGGIAVVVLLLLVYWRFLKWLKKLKAAPMERGVIENTSATPQGIGEAAQVARLDDLRKKFEDGIEKFHAAGKSLYNFPWYMIVGEPGSGKTEAIRHCNVGFPPGLQDQFQGAGGTLNMNWWFTDHAVILDTAGRLMFEEVETGGSSEWKEFLKLLKKNRLRCPINGVFLVIPADSLITDTADEIAQKASKIARQFDVIQRTLDVRFPVFVVITKSDLINGFRDFFEGLDDPQLQHQILGWSNPAPLDVPYDPEFVGQHLKTIQERLFRRRLGLIQDIMSEEPGIGEKRAVDTLFAFPQSLAKLSPRLARYLEMIFSVGSKWSCKPLFFRGIYFTSSMREGSALDEDLAESLGVPVESLPEGRVWERDRAYFLRDLFMKKVFREKGLVTYATNATKQHTRRKAAILISAAASVVLLLLWTFYANHCFSTSVRVLSGILGAELLSSGKLDEEIQVIKKEGDDSYRYIGRSGIRGMPADVNRCNFCARLDSAIGQWENEGGVPWIFWPVAWVASDITPDRLRKAEAVIYEIGVLKPFLKTTGEVMEKQQDGKWRCEDPGTKVMRQLIQIRVNKPLNKEGEYSAKSLLNPFFEYVFGRVVDGEEQENLGKRMIAFEEDKKQLHEPIAGTYGSVWPPVSLKTEPNFGNTAILHGVELFNAYWSDANRVVEDSEEWTQVEAIRKLRGDLDRFDAAEERILSISDRAGPKSPGPYVDKQWDKTVSRWGENFAILRGASESIQTYYSVLKTPLPLEEHWTKAVSTVVQDVNRNYECLLNEIGDVNKDGFLGIIRDRLQQGRAEVANKLQNSDVEGRIKLLDKDFYRQVKDGRNLYQVRFEMYSEANKQIGKVGAVSRVEQVPEVVRESEKTAGEARHKINELQNLDSTAFRFQKAADVSRYVVDSAEQMRVYDIIRGGLEAAPKSVEELENLIEGQASGDWACIPAQIIEKKFDPNSAATVFSGWKVLGDTLADTSKYVLPPELREMYNANGAVYTEYGKRYVDYYWLDKVPDSKVRSMVSHEKSWKVQHGWFEKLVVWDVLLELNKFGKCIDEAVGRFENHIPAGYEKVKQFRTNKDKISDKLFQTKCERLIEKWAALSNDPFEAKNTILNGKPGLLVKDYFPFSADSPVEFVDMYWTVLSEDSLAILVNEVKTYESEVLNKLRTRYGGKFPLVRDSAIDLTYDEYKEVYSLLSKTGTRGDLDPTTVGGGADTGLARVDKLLEQLRPSAVSDKRVQAIKKLFRGLPEPPASYYCKIILPNGKEQERLLGANEALLWSVFREFRVIQGTQTCLRLRTNSVDEKGTPVCTVLYPGSSIRFEFYSYPSDDQPSASLEFLQPWACLRMLCLAEPDKGRYIKLNVKDNQGSGGVLFLRLEFCREYDGKCDIDLPKLSEWPLSQRQ